MAVIIPIETYIAYAKICQFLAADDINEKQLLQGGSLNYNLSKLLYVVRNSVQWRFDTYPDSDVLNSTGKYLLQLCGQYLNQARSIVDVGVCTSVFIVVNPSDQTVTEGASASFSVTAGGTLPITYQWQKDGVDIPGATGSIYNIAVTTTGDAGSYRCLLENPCGTATSTTAILTVNAVPVTGSYWYGTVNNYADIVAGTDSLTYLGTFNITGETLNVPFPVGASNNKYLVVRVPRATSDKDVWNYDSFNFGNIPDINFYEVVKPVGLPSYTYYLTRVDMSLDFPAHTLDLSVSP